MDSHCAENSKILRAIRTKCLIFCFLSLLNLNSHITVVAAATAVHDASETDHIALLAFKLKINFDPESILMSWNNSLHFCFWEGVFCEHKRVIILDLSSKGLVGSLSPHIGNLSFLREIRLQNNTLQGEIRPELGRLFRLQVLRLDNNSFEGEIPRNLSHSFNLSVLYLANNKLSGKIPLELASLSKLQQLDFRQNSLTGGIPQFLGNLSSLKVLYLRSNVLYGSIPDALGQLKNLEKLGLADNNLSGTIPSSMYNLSSVSVFSVSQNELEGTLPEDIGLTLPSLQWLQIWGNHFSGSLPVSLSNASKLQFIDMGGNQFTGKIGVDFGNMRQLFALYLRCNKLGSGESDELSFITSLSNCSNLNTLSLDDNQLEGVLPSSIGNLSIQLKYLSIPENRLFGILPYGLGNLTNLMLLDIRNNHFSDTIPSGFGHLQNLNELDLSYNNFSGEIPYFLGNLTLLGGLFLNHNQFQGTIPSSLGQCQNLLRLDLSRNNLNGTIPKQLFDISSMPIYLNLSQNNLVGSLPLEIGNWLHLNQLDLSENMFSGQIPNNLGKCNSLESLYLQNNTFEGNLYSFSSLRGLKNLDLSRNNLSGDIPKYLETFSLDYLNFSFNNFEGEVPVKGVFANASAVSFVGNDRLCGGISELELRRCIRKPKRSKLGLVKIIVVLVVCLSFVVATVSLFLFGCLKRKKKEQHLASWPKGQTWNASYGSLSKATSGFSSATLVGVGSFGSVYKGIVDENGAIVAVKVLNLQRHGAFKSFTAECKALGNVRHRNLLKIITCCSSIDYQGNDFKALVYEFMPNGSLDKWLHPVSKANDQQTEPRSLSLRQRINIAIDIATALEYLHHRCQNPIVHCDLKPSNVLLDNDMVAHVGDFGLAKFYSHDLTNSYQSSSVGVRGTIGYTAPEYGLGSEVSASGDVYSYGILLLEMMTGKKPTDNFFQEGLNLHKFASTSEPDQLGKIIDPLLLNDGVSVADNNQEPMGTTKGQRSECLTSMALIGVSCSMENSQDRMDIRDAVKELHSIRDILKPKPTLSRTEEELA